MTDKKRVRLPNWPTLSVPGVVDTLPHGVECMRWSLKTGGCSLWWCEWPAELEEPPLASGGHYRKMRIYDKEVQMPRRTWCYGHAYAFSGQTHPVEPQTPPQVSALYAWANAACGIVDATRGFNMDLCNHYATGFHCINAHSDDERQFGAVHDVICFVTGPATRRIVIRDKQTKKPVLEGLLPAGVYCMAGRAFQQHYTHEFPRIHDTLFAQVLKEGPRWFGAERWPAQLQSKAELAEWLAQHGEEVLTHLDPKQATKWREWLLPRTSHTLRNFSE
jgi:hypothetical protein